MWLFQSPKQRLRAVALEIVQGLADGTIVPDAPLLLEEGETLAQPSEDKPVPSAIATLRPSKGAFRPVMPLDDRVVVEPLEAEPLIVGGLILLDAAQRGRVVAVGPGKLLDDGKRVALAVAKGDQVLYGKYAGDDAKVDSKEVKILRESDILAKIVQ